VLYVESAAARKDWKNRLEEAIGLREAVLDNRRVFELVPMCSRTFTAGPHRSGGESAAGSSGSAGKPTCSVPFSASAFSFFKLV
jgi:hypothetical protein